MIKVITFLLFYHCMISIARFQNFLIQHQNVNKSYLCLFRVVYF